MVKITSKKEWGERYRWTFEKNFCAWLLIWTAVFVPICSVQQPNRKLRKEEKEQLFKWEKYKERRYGPDGLGIKQNWIETGQKFGQIHFFLWATDIKIEFALARCNRQIQFVNFDCSVKLHLLLCPLNLPDSLLFWLVSISWRVNKQLKCIPKPRTMTRSE